MKKILILGGTGFLGRNLQDVFREQNIEGTFIGRGNDNEYNLLDYHKAARLFSAIKPDIVINSAAQVGGIEFNKNNPGSLIRDNLQIGINVFDACKEFGVKNLYYVGTCCSYPQHCPIPFREEDLWNGAEDPSNSAYGVAKKACLKMGEAYRKQYGLKSTCFILANLYGKYDNFDDKSSHIVPALIKKFLHAKEHNLPEVHCFGTGKATRDLLNAHAAAECITKAVLQNFDHPDPINIGTGVEVSIREVSEMIKELTHYRGEIVFDGSVGDGQPRRCLSTSRVQSLLNWEANVSLIKGIQKTIEYFTKNNE